MGPRPDGRGRPFRFIPGDRPKERQWGRDRMAAEGRSRRVRRPSGCSVNGAATGWPRKGARLRMDRRDHFGVNGAATGWPRKAHGQRLLPLSRDASMGPRPDGRGRFVRPAIPADNGKRQWGRDRMAAEGVRTRRLVSSFESRQWGRDRMAAEGC